MSFKKQVQQHNSEKNERKKILFKNLHGFWDGRERVLDASENKIFPTDTEGTDFSDKVSDHSNLKILTPKNLFQR